MPNHFLVVGLCARDYEQLAQTGKEDPAEINWATLKGVNLCELLRPLPAELEDIIAGAWPSRYVHRTTGAVRHASNPPFGADRDEWEQVPLCPDEIDSLRRKYGAVDWHGWQRTNWGTKWGTYDTCVHELGGDGAPVLIEFQTAWGPPNPEMMRQIEDYLCEAYCLKNIKWIGHEPYDGTTVEIPIAAKVTI